MVDREQMKTATDHREIVEAVTAALESLFEDTTVAKAITFDDLVRLRERIDEMLESLPSD